MRSRFSEYISLIYISSNTLAHNPGSVLWESHAQRSRPPDISVWIASDWIRFILWRKSETILIHVYRRMKYWIDIFLINGAIHKYLVYKLSSRNARSCFVGIWVLIWSAACGIARAPISDHIPGKVRNEITYPFSNFNSCTVGVWGWISNSSYNLQWM